MFHDDLSKTLLLHSVTVPDAILEIEGHGGRVTQQLSPNILLAIVPKDVDEMSLKSSTTDIRFEDQDEASILAVEGWRQEAARPVAPGAGMEVNEDQATQAATPAPPFGPPRGPQFHVEEVTTGGAIVAQAAAAAADYVTNEAMTGKVVINLLLISGDGQLAWSEAEKKEFRGKTAKATQWLASLEPGAQLSFVYDTHVITLAGDNHVKTVEMSGSPALAVYFEKLWCFHQGQKSNGELWYTVHNGETWEKDAKVPDTGLSESPSAVAYGNQLYVLHQGFNNDGSLWWTSYSGFNWAKDQRVDGTNIGSSPSGVVFNDRLYCFHRGGGKSNELWFNVFNEKTWVGDRQVPKTGLSNSPSAVVFKAKLYVFHQGSGGDGALWYNVYNGNTWAGDKKVTGSKLSGSPAAVVQNGLLCVFFQGPKNDGKLRINLLDVDSATGAETWGGDQLSREGRESDTVIPNVGLSDSPAVALWNRQTYCLHQGSGGNGQLWYRVFDPLATNDLIDYTIESLVRNPALGILGYAKSLQGARQCANTTGQRYGTTRAYTVFCHKFPSYGNYSFLNRFTDQRGYHYMMMGYPPGSDNWDVLDHTFAHETTHIFGTPEEYGDCSCKNKYGTYRVKNANCAQCAGSKYVPCLMGGPVGAPRYWDMCFYTRGQVGWPAPQGLFVFHHGEKDKAGQGNGSLWYSVLHNGAWYRDRAVPNTMLTGSPAVVKSGFKTYVFHQGTNNSKELWFNALDRLDWDGDQRVPKTEMGGSPSAVEFHDEIYVFHQGSGSNGKLFYNVFKGKGNWAGDKQIAKIGISANPCAVIFNKKIYLFHQGANKVGELWFTSSTDGKTWSKDIHVDGVGMSSSPSAVAFKKKLYVFHQGFKDNGQLWYVVLSEDGKSFGKDTQVPNTRLSESPGAAVFGNKLFVFHQGEGGNMQLWYNSSADGARWDGDAVVGNVRLTSEPGVVAGFTSFPDGPFPKPPVRILSDGQDSDL